MKWFVKCIKNYVNFSGRAQRAEYWYFILFTIIFMIAAGAIDALLFGCAGKRVFLTILAFFLFLPQLAVMVRRLHDTGRSGKLLLWYYLAAITWAVALVVASVVALGGLVSASMSAMPMGVLALLCGGGLVIFVWEIFFLVWFCTRGTKGDNKYGPDPLADEK